MLSSPDCPHSVYRDYIVAIEVEVACEPMHVRGAFKLPVTSVFAGCSLQRESFVTAFA
jgi:hypothetical protein